MKEGREGGRKEGRRRREGRKEGRKEGREEGREEDVFCLPCQDEGEAFKWFPKLR